MSRPEIRNENKLRNVLVYAANGVQGGAIARALRDEGFLVRACVRDSRKAAELARSMEIVEADLDDRASLAAANRGVDGSRAFRSRNAEHRGLGRGEKADRFGSWTLIQVMSGAGCRELCAHVPRAPTINARQVVRVDQRILISRSIAHGL